MSDIFTPEQKKDFADYAQKIADQMGRSALCLAIFTDNYKESIDSLIQFAIALMMDKPLILFVREGTKVPVKVRQVADHIEYYNDENQVEAFRRMMTYIQDARKA